jgi:hypothetical protein
MILHISMNPLECLENSDSKANEFAALFLRVKFSFAKISAGDCSILMVKFWFCVAITCSVPRGSSLCRCCCLLRLCHRCRVSCCRISMLCQVWIGMCRFPGQDHLIVYKRVVESIQRESFRGELDFYWFLYKQN